MKSLLIVINPISGRSSKKSVVSAIESHIDRNKYDVAIRFTEYAGHATVLAEEAVKAAVADYYKKNNIPFDAKLLECTEEGCCHLAAHADH